MQGLFRIKNDPRFAAAHISDTVVLFPGVNGMAHRDQPQAGSLDDLSDNALLTQVTDVTLQEATEAFLEKRQPRWRS